MRPDPVLRRVGIGVTVALAVVLALAVVVVVLGVGSGDAHAQDDTPEVGRETLTLRYRPEDEIATPLIVDELDPQTVLTVVATGFEADTTGRVRQCVEGTQRRCTNELAVRFDNLGSAAFQYLVTPAVGGPDPDPCRLGASRCTVELSVGDRTMEIETVFVDRAPPPGRLSMTPRNDLLVGDAVTVTATGFPPGATMTATVCAAPSTRGSRCGAPAPELALTIGPDGAAEAVMRLDVAEVGADGVACGRRVQCRVVVISDEIGVRAPPVTLSFTDAPGADYDTGRVVLGAAAAVALGLLAVGLRWSTDWDPPPEADSSAIDDAAYADLDMEAALFDDAAPTPVP